MWVNNFSFDYFLKVVTQEYYDGALLPNTYCISHSIMSPNSTRTSQRRLFDVYVYIWKAYFLECLRVRE